MYNLQVFENTDFGKIRTIEDDGQIWFCGSDVALALGYVNSRDAVKRHCKKEGVVKHDTPTSSGIQNIIFISEPNLYRLICNSKLKSAEKFEKWVFEEVLPAIRKTGSYTSNKKDNSNVRETSLIVAEVINAIVPIITKSIIEVQQRTSFKETDFKINKKPSAVIKRVKKNT